MVGGGGVMSIIHIYAQSIIFYSYLICVYCFKNILLISKFIITNIFPALLLSCISICASCTVNNLSLYLFVQVVNNLSF